ncbi:hypothetical protein HPC49_14905 [Pyxidicoccus fallax]|uniref:Metallo-beta-lactamase domain-containing protein n=1 Tax=Pyxidicoccus fallax TaxID=394095 RepID=A0A848L7V7_9BACT|nr:MBL fold metallo-hydrolase [Pyxidicoccus fallax]NMO14646.1 hypothetical protein [Pyxidicoccus fallax]NPC79521.1 hypothetical protein [Pyxidicoccus fallax]
MFNATFIGHQGWLLETADTRLLVDPLLADTFGNTPGREACVFPPREIQFERFPAVSAVLLTHEHEDHLSPASLDRLSRDIPIYISGNSSSAAADILQEMGFEARRLFPGQVLSLGDLNVLGLGPGHVRHEANDEWDVLPFLAWDRDGHGSFFSSVDVATTDEMLQRARTQVRKPGIVALSWNTMHLGWRMVEPKPADPFGTAQSLAQSALETYSRLSRLWGAPAAIAVSGTGFSLQDDMAWLNRNAFVLEAQQVVDAVQQLGIPTLLVAPKPGEALSMAKERACRVVTREFVRSARRQHWPERTFVGDQPAVPADYAPACGKREAGPAEKDAIEKHLVELAHYLYGTRVFQDLLSVHADELRDRRRSIALVLKRAEAPSWVFEYNLQQCRFVPRESINPYSSYPAGIECWATDLLALFEGRVVASSGVGLGRSRVWSAVPGRFTGLYTQLFVRFFHPLRRPEAALALYRRVWSRAQESRSSAPRVALQNP